MNSAFFAVPQTVLPVRNARLALRAGLGFGTLNLELGTLNPRPRCASVAGWP